MPGAMPLTALQLPPTTSTVWSPCPDWPAPLQLTSDLQNLRTDMHEIDFEYINGDPATAPGCLWTNVYVEGKLRRAALV